MSKTRRNQVLAAILLVVAAVLFFVGDSATIPAAIIAVLGFGLPVLGRSSTPE